MENSFLTVGTQVFILFILMALGFLARKLKWLDQQSVSGITNLMLYLITPCLLINAFQRPFAAEQMRGFLITAAAAAGTHIVAIFLSMALIHNKDKAKQSVQRFAAIFSNCGYMSLPLQQALLGDEAVFSARVEDASCQWQVSEGDDWRDLTDGLTLYGSETDTLHVVTSESRADKAYRLVASGEAGEQVSDAVTFQVQEKVIAREQKFDRQPHDAVIARLGDEVVFSARAAGASYQWQYNDGSGWKNLTESATWHGVETDTLRFVSSLLRLELQYRVVVTGEAGVCVSNRVRFTLAEQ